MPGHTLDIEDLLEAPDDPHFIPGVFNYCHRRCERCPFTARCRLYADEQRDRQAFPDSDWKERVHRSFERTKDMVKRWCAREGIDFDRFNRDSQSAEPADELRAIQEVRKDPLQQLAERYTFPAMKIAAAIRQSPETRSWPREARDALETIEWFGIRVSSKVHRALLGYERRDELPDEDPVQSDWNGSAKVARLDIAESRAAWLVILKTGEAPEDSPLRRMVGLLDEIDAGIAERFPDAMAFVRPGFDTTISS